MDTTESIKEKEVITMLLQMKSNLTSQEWKVFLFLIVKIIKSGIVAGGIMNFTENDIRDTLLQEYEGFNTGLCINHILKYAILPSLSTAFEDGTLFTEISHFGDFYSVKTSSKLTTPVIKFFIKELKK